jgi:hypothetical protein
MKKLKTMFQKVVKLKLKLVILNRLRQLKPSQKLNMF